MLPKVHQVHRPHPAFIFPALMGFPSHIQADGSHTQAVSSMSTVLTHPRGFSYMPAPSLHTFPRIPHTTKLQKIRPQIQRDLLHIFANQAPAKSSKYHMPATGGGAGTYARARPRACTRISVQWSYLHGHARAFTAMVTSLRLDPHASGHASAETSADGFGRSTLQSNPLKSPGGHGHGVVSRCDDGVDVDDSGDSTCMCDRAIEPKGQITVKP